MKLALAVLAGLFIFAGAAAPARAADDKLASISAWFKNLKEGLRESAVSGRRQHSRSVSAVAAVRGDEQTAVDPNRPEWKTSSKSEKAELRKEKKELAAAVDLIVAGKYDDGKAAIDQFQKDHPKSKFNDEASKARENADLLAQLRPAAPAKAETAPTEGAPAKAEEKAAESAKPAEAVKPAEEAKPAEKPAETPADKK